MGTGGSGGGGRKLTAKYGTRQASRGSGRNVRPSSGSTKTESETVRRAIESWRKSGKPGDQRDEQSTARALTRRFAQRTKKKTKSEDEDRITARELTKKYGVRRG